MPVDDYYSMEMIGHNNEFIKSDMRIMIRYCKPGIIYDNAGFGKYHFAIPDFSKIGDLIFCTDCNEIFPRSCIIIIRIAGGFYPVFIPVK